MSSRKCPVCLEPCFSDETGEQILNLYAPSCHHGVCKGCIRGIMKIDLYDSKPIEDIEVQDVIRVLKPIWIKKTVTAQRVMQRIARVIGMAKSLGLYHKDNPAIWKGNLEFNLSDPIKINKVRHHPAMP